MAITFTRFILDTSSSMGPSSTSTTSLLSNFRTASLSVFSSLLRTDTVTTFMRCRTTDAKRSFVKKPSPSSSTKCLKTFCRPSSSGAVSSASSPSASALAFGSCGFGGRLHVTKNLTNSASEIFPSWSASTALNSSSLLNFASFWWYLKKLRALASSASISAITFLFAMSRSLPGLPASLPSRCSEVFILPFTSPAFCVIHALMSSSTSSRRPVTISFDFSMLVFASSSSLSSSSASLPSSSTSSFMALPNTSFDAACTLSTSSPVALAASAAASMLACTSFFSSSILASFSNRAFLRSASMACSRAIPTWTLSLWKSSFFTPLLSPSTRFLKICAMAASPTANLWVVLAYVFTSGLLRIPSPSLSNLAKLVFRTSIFFLASAFFPIFATVVLANASASLHSFVHTEFLVTAFASAAPVSIAPGFAGSFGGSLIFALFSLTKSATAFTFALAMSPFSSTALAFFSTSFIDMSAASFSGSALSFSVLTAFSASSTSDSSSFRSSSANFLASSRSLAASASFSWASRFTAATFSTRSIAICKPFWDSSCIFWAWAPQFARSFASAASSSCFISAMFSGVAVRSFWMTRRIVIREVCSCRFLASSASRCCFCCSCFIFRSSCCFFMSSIFFSCICFCCSMSIFCCITAAAAAWLCRAWAAMAWLCMACMAAFMPPAAAGAALCWPYDCCGCCCCCCCLSDSAGQGAAPWSGCR
mmetsp:Transcript_1352/g.3782  ORF Transcript_1352/g.3782 Transcript_1352/m.3782 type:complete len:710 (-) Transcript_1352:207-2336(-)